MKKYSFKLLSLFLALTLAVSAVMSANADDIVDNSNVKEVEIRGAGVMDYSLNLTCDYSDSYFYEDNTVYNPKLAMLTLEMAMAAFNTPEYLHGDTDSRLPAEYNIDYSYKSLGFENAKYYNYDIPVTDKSDKVAFSFATKDIKDPSGAIDTLIAVIVRGGNYGGEWVSNFHAYDSDDPLYTEPHYGFKTAAKKLYDAFNSFLYENGDSFKGNIKLWTTGYSRGAAVSNAFAHLVNTSQEIDAVSKYLSRNNIYAYQFACPPGGRESLLDAEADKNIFVVSSPCDFVPMIPFTQWGFSVYGNLRYLPDTMNVTAQKYFDELLSGTKYEGNAPCSHEQAETFSDFSNKLSSTFTEDTYKRLQDTIMRLVGKAYESEDELSSSGGLTNNKLVIVALGAFLKLKTDFDLEKNFNAIVYGHLPEHYLALIYSSLYRDDTEEDDSDTETDTEIISDSDIMSETDTQSDTDDTDTMPDTETDTSSDREKYKLLGDATIDGKVDMQDVVEIQRYIAKLVQFIPEQSINSDVNEDSFVNMLDITQLQLFIAGLIDAF